MNVPSRPYPVVTPKGQLKKWLVNSALTVTSVLLAVAAVELALIARGAFRPPPDPVLPAQPELFEPHPLVGYRLQPSRRTSYRYPSSSLEDIPVTSNSDGFRSHRELDAAEAPFRILVVGDSFVFGQGVLEEDRLSEHLEALHSDHWQVDNIAMPGWGLDLMIRAIDAYGAKSAPNLVVLALYSDDFRRLMPQFAGMGYAYAKFELSEGELVTVPYEYPSRLERLRVVQMVYQAAWSGRRDRYDLNGALLARFLDQSRTNGFIPFIMFIPQKGLESEDAPRRKFLTHWVQANGVRFLDLTEVIAARDSASVYIPGDIHWTALGHRMAAGALSLALADY